MELVFDEDGSQRESRGDAFGVKKTSSLSVSSEEEDG
jgi:hypothetical protein